MANKLRSGLTILGIVIGVSSVVFLVSFGQGHQANIKAIFESMGANAIYVTGVNMQEQMTGRAESLTIEDAEALNDPNHAPSIGAVAPLIEKMAKVSYGNEKKTTDIIGTTPDILKMTTYPVAAGDFISEADVRRATNVAVLGHQVASDLFGEINPIGEIIRVAGKQFEVIGIIEKRGVDGICR